MLHLAICFINETGQLIQKQNFKSLGRRDFPRNVEEKNPTWCEKCLSETYLKQFSAESINQVEQDLVFEEIMQ